MAPTKPTSKGKSSSKGGAKGGSKGKSGGASKSKSTGKEPEGISKRKQKSMKLAKPGGAQKTKSKGNDGRKKKRVYTEAELDIPKLNSIIPAGVAKPKGQKKGKVFVDDPASMMAIMSVVNAQKEGHIESKIMRSRQLEEIREAKRKEAEARADEKKEKFEETKQSLKKQKTQRKKNKHAEPLRRADAEAAEKTAPKPKKRVSFG